MGLPKRVDGWGRAAGRWPSTLFIGIGQTVGGEEILAK
jgi:hypothetical protein